MHPHQGYRVVVASQKAYRLAKEALPCYSHAKSPHYFRLPQLAACVLMRYYLDLSYRDLEEWLMLDDRICRILELSRIPDHSTLQRTYRKLSYLDFETLKKQMDRERI